MVYQNQIENLINLMNFFFNFEGNKRYYYEQAKKSIKQY